MEDLNGLDWNISRASRGSLPPAGYSAFRATPTPTAPTPQILSRPSSTLNGNAKAPVKSASPANDSFSNLLSFNTAKGSSSVTLQDRQKQLLDEKRRQAEEQQKRHQHEAQFWDSMGTAGAKVASTSTSVNGSRGGAAVVEDVDDILAAFASSAPVDKSSHFPPPSSASVSGRTTPAIVQRSRQDLFDSDDDPFGLGSMPERPLTSRQEPAVPDPDDDFLGALGRPVISKPRLPRTVDVTTDTLHHESSASSVPEPDPHDRALSELVDMGFPVDRASVALAETNGNLQSAVSFLLNQAHDEAKQKNKSRNTSEQRRSPVRNGHGPAPPASQRAPQESRGAMPAWMQQESHSEPAQARQDSRSSAPEKDVAQYATEIGSTLFKSANILWRTGQKKVQKAVAEFQQEGDSSQPKWMRDASADTSRSGSQRRDSTANRTTSAPVPQAANVTDEALLLESGGGRPTKTTRQAASDSWKLAPEGPPSRGRSPAHDLPERLTPQPRFTQQPPPQTRAPVKPSRQAVEEEASQAYVSSSRRRKAAPAPAPVPEPAVDLFSPAPQAASTSRPPPQTSQPTPVAAPSPTKSRTAPASAAPPRPKPVSRNIPAVSPQALSTSTQHRRAGTEAFKRGDYASAHEAYTAGLHALPQTHPLTIVLLSNRALTALKTGDAKTAVSDANTALTLIGPAKGDDEVIDLGAGEGAKPMRDFYAKALMRKAEALEHMEKWPEAGAVWREAVASGVGGAVGLRGRDRCEKAASGGGTAAATTATAPKSRAQPSAAVPRKVPAAISTRPAANSQSGASQSAAAVKKLRAANAAADRADDEKFLLADTVAARIDAWKGGKSDNLRALLASLDAVLWAEAGWKKVGMGDLIVASRVKVVYMKAIAKVHPDKIPQSATVEQQMVSAAVFSALNEAWDKFKSDNGL